MRLPILAAAAALAFSSQAHAQAAGDIVNLTYYDPTISSVFQDLGNTVLDTNSSYNFVVYFKAIATNSSLTIDFLVPGNWFVASFNGFVFTDLTEAFGRITLDPATNMAGFTTAKFIASGNRLSVNW